MGELIDLSLAIEDGMPAHALFPSPLKWVTTKVSALS